MLRISLAFLMLFGCGNGGGNKGTAQESASTDQPGSSDVGNQTSIYINSADDLPECGDANKNSLAYIQDESAFYYCDTEWKVAEIKSDDEESESLIKSIITCDGSQDLDAASDVDRYGLSADITEFTSGDYLITCTASEVDGYYTYSDTDSATALWSKDSKGVLSGNLTCIPMYVTATYSIKNKTIVYKNQADNAESGAIDCEEVFPGN